MANLLNDSVQSNSSSGLTAPSCCQLKKSIEEKKQTYFLPVLRSLPWYSIQSFTSRFFLGQLKTEMLLIYPLSW